MSRGLKSGRASYTEEEKETILAYAKEHTAVQAAIKYEVSSASISKWKVTKEGSRSDKKRGAPSSFSIEKKTDAVQFSMAHGVQVAADKFGVHRKTMLLWRKELEALNVPLVASDQNKVIRVSPFKMKQPSYMPVSLPEKVEENPATEKAKKLFLIYSEDASAILAILKELI